MNKRIKEAVLKKYNGHCAYCGIELTIGRMHIDHIHPKSGWKEVDDNNELLDINRIDNLNPSCRECNSYKHFYSINEFRGLLDQLLWTNPEYLFKSVTKMKIAERFGAIRRVEWDGLFYFEKFKKEGGENVES